MATNPSTIQGSPRGIKRTLSGFVIESETITETPVQEDFDDQDGARADEQVYDTRVDLKLTIYAATAQASIGSIVVAMPTGYTGKRINYKEPGSNSQNRYFKVDSCEEAGTYNGRKRWNITAHKFDNFPPQN